MKERGKMPRQQRRIQLPPVSTMFLCVLGGVYLVYLMALGNVLYTWVSARTETIIEHPVNTNPDVVVKHWTVASMRAATDADQQVGTPSDLTQGSLDTSQGKVAQQQ